MQNDILHSKDSIGARIRNEHLTEQLFHFKYNADTMATEIRLTTLVQILWSGHGHEKVV